MSWFLHGSDFYHERVNFKQIQHSKRIRPLLSFDIAHCHVDNNKKT